MELCVTVRDATKALNTLFNPWMLAALDASPSQLVKFRNERPQDLANEFSLQLALKRRWDPVMSAGRSANDVG